MGSESGRRRAGAALGIYAAFLVFVLLNPSADVPSGSVSLLAEIGARIGLPAPLLEPGRVEFVANAMILVPLSFLGSATFPRLDWRDWTAHGFLLSGSVEGVQALLLPARSATFVDVVANTAGTLVGAVAFTLATRALRRAGYRRAPR